LRAARRDNDVGSPAACPPKHHGVSVRLDDYYHQLVGVATKSTKHAAGLYRRTFAAALRPIRKIEAEAQHLHEVERTGESEETPFIAILGLFLFLVPIVVLVLGLALLAAHLLG
jgi:hypothetical protein